MQASTGGQGTSGGFKTFVARPAARPSGQAQLSSGVDGREDYGQARPGKAESGHQFSLPRGS